MKQRPNGMGMARWRTLRDDSGVAMVAAISVAIIGMALALVVVTQAVVVTNDSQRDRVRTAEIHSAEGVLDATFYEMTSELACDAPSFSPITVGEGTSQVEVTVTYQYFDDDGAFDASDCNASTGLLSSSPTGAVVTATAVPTSPTAAGIAPQRIIEATVQLVPGQMVADESAIFAGGTLTTNTNFGLTPVDPNHMASIRVRGTSWSCNTGSTVNGNVIVINGSATLNVNCNITGSIWTKGNLTLNSNVTIGGSATVADGNFSANTNAKITGAVRVKGTTSFNTGATAGSVCSSNTTPCPAGTFDPPEDVPLPEFDYVATDWTSQGFQILSTEAFNDVWKAQSGATEPWQINALNPANCAFYGWNWWSGTKRLNLNGGAGVKKDTVYDLRSCSSLNFADMTFVLYADTAIFAKTTNFNTGVRFESGDGLAHNLYLVVPEGGTANNGVAECSSRGSYTPGNMTFNTGNAFVPPIQTILYTPCNLSVNVGTTFRGQVYARNINLNTNNGFEFIPVPVPGDPLSVTTESTGDYSVQVLYKHERRN